MQWKLYYGYKSHDIVEVLYIYVYAFVTTMRKHTTTKNYLNHLVEFIVYINFNIVMNCFLCLKFMWICNIIKNLNKYCHVQNKMKFCLIEKYRNVLLPCRYIQHYQYLCFIRKFDVISNVDIVNDFCKCLYIIWKPQIDYTKHFNYWT